MATGLPTNRPLQSLSNIDLAHRNKKVITTPTRPPAPSQSRVPKDKDPFVVSLFSRPLFVDIEKPVAKPHVRKIYERDFLLKFKYAYTDFPPGAITPNEMIAQYNKEFELKERQAGLEPSTLFVKKIIKPAPAEAEKQETSIIEKEPTKAKLIKTPREKKGVLKLRNIPSSPNVSRLAMFSPKPAPSPSPAQPATSNQDDKENKISTVLKTKPQQPPVPVPVIEAVADAVIPALVVEPITPAVANVVEPETTVADPTDDLNKKIKGMLKEDDPRRLSQRQKQIDYGKNTAGYVNYIAAVPKSKRKREDPKTPNKHQVCSKRSWDGQIRKWRRMLHFYDPTGTDLLEDGEDVDIPEASLEIPTVGERQEIAA